MVTSDGTVDSSMNEDSRRCPECGYLDADARFHMDHRLCRNYPYFTRAGEYEFGVLEPNPLRA